MATRRKRIGGIGSTRGRAAQAVLLGDKELVRKVRRMTDDLRVEVLEGALEDAVEETRAWEQQLAPRAPGAGSRGYHGADFIVDRKAWTRKRDTRAMLVGPDHRLARHLMFQEFGTIYHPAQPFIRPVVRKMRPRTLEIVADHAKRAVGL